MTSSVFFIEGFHLKKLLRTSFALASIISLNNNAINIIDLKLEIVWL